MIIGKQLKRHAETKDRAIRELCLAIVAEACKQYVECFELAYINQSKAKVQRRTLERKMNGLEQYFKSEDFKNIIEAAECSLSGDAMRRIKKYEKRRQAYLQTEIINP